MFVASSSPGLDARIAYRCNVDRCLVASQGGKIKARQTHVFGEDSDSTVPNEGLNCAKRTDRHNYITVGSSQGKCIRRKSCKSYKTTE